MRLSAAQIEAIKQETEHFFGAQAEVWLFGSRVDKHQRGFTLVELIMTMVIIGIISAVAAPRFFDNNVFQARGFADQVQASLRYAQKTAIAQRRFVCVGFPPPAPDTTVTLTIDTTVPADGICDAALPSPAGDPAYVITAPAGVTFTALPTPLSFNALGVPTIPQTITVTGAANTITIEPTTGYVHSP